MATQIQQQQGRSLWGRLAGVRAARKERPAAPVAHAPTHRPLTVKDALYTVDATGRRVYVPLTVDGVTGRWAGREWQHCGERDGLLMARWHERDNAAAPLCWRSLASGSVCVVEGGTVA